MDYKNIIELLVNTETESTSGQERYLEVHKKRFEYTLGLCKEITPSANTKVLDVGRSYFTMLLSEYYEDVTSLGLPLDKDHGGHREKNEKEEINHLVFDLNNSKKYDIWPKTEKKFDLITYAETIEHIYTAPEFSLLMLHSLLSDQGQLIITTPNAGAFHKRIRLLIGMHPYHKIRYFDQNPGHYREYMMSELINMCTSTGYKVDSAIYKNFSLLNPFSSLKALKYLPIKPFEYVPFFKDTLVIVASKDKNERVG